MRRFWFVVTAVVIAASSWVGTAITAPTGGTPNKAPYVVKFPWGTFKLAPRIANKLQNNEPLNILFSMEGKTIPIYGPQYLYNFPKGIAQAQDDWGLQLKGKLIGPVQFNSNEQIAQVRSELATNQWDCVVIEPGSLDAFAPVINKAVDSGIPVFTTGTDVPRSKRFGTFHTDWVFEGGLDARTAVAYLKKKGIPLKAAYMSTGNIDAVWAQDRMNGFYNTLKQIAPGVQILNTPKDALMTGYDPPQVYAQNKAFLQGHPDVQIVYQTDVGEQVARAISDAGRKGKTFLVGHNVSLVMLDSIQKGLAIATLDQNYLAQSSYPGRACGAFFSTGRIFPNTNQPVVITQTNLVEQKKKFIETTQPKR